MDKEMTDMKGLSLTRVVDEAWIGNMKSNIISDLVVTYKFKLLIIVLGGLLSVIIGVTSAYLFVVNNYVTRAEYDRVNDVIGLIYPKLHTLISIPDKVISFESKICGCGYIGDSQVITGPRGRDGTKIITGDGPPMNNTGNYQDLYIDYTSKFVYQKNGDWEQLMEIGNQGKRGETGRDGERGLVGNDGPEGPRGSQGLKGEKGDKGDVGERGAQGITGMIGPMGASGLKGDEGKQGLKGDKGDPGECVGCPNGKSDDCCGIKCVICQSSFTCIQGQCGEEITSSNTFDNLDYLFIPGKFTKPQCDIRCRMTFNGARAYKLIFPKSVDETNYIRARVTNGKYWMSPIFINNTYSWEGNPLIFQLNTLNPTLGQICIYGDSRVPSHSSAAWYVDYCDSVMGCLCTISSM